MKQTAAGLMLMLALQGVASAHDMVSNRLSLVQREPNHVSMTLVIDYVQAMQAVAAPKASLKEFVIACSGMADGPLQRTLGQAQLNIEQGIVLRDTQHRLLRVTALHWPSLADARRLLQQAAMGSIALASDKPEPAALELQADVTSGQVIDGIEIQLPPALTDMTVVSYKPVQTRIDSLSHKATVRF
jgi:hypothetical protein